MMQSSAPQCCSLLLCVCSLVQRCSRGLRGRRRASARDYHALQSQGRGQEVMAAEESHRKLKFLWIVACVAVVAILCFLYVKPSPVKHIDRVTPAGQGAEHGACATTPSNTETSGSTTNHIYGYLLSANIAQQSTGALSGYGDIAALAGYLDLSTVEPYVVDNYFRGVPKQGEEGRAMPLSTFYDFENLEYKIKSCFNKKKDILEMSTFEQFLTKTSSAVIYAHVLHSLGNFKSKFSDGKQKIVEIDINDGSAKNDLKRLNDWAAYISKEHNVCSVTFKIKQVFVIDARPQVPLKLTTIQGVLGSAIRKLFSMNGSVTVMFNFFRAIHDKPNGYFYYVPHFYKPCDYLNNTGHSQTVIKASQAFSRHLKDSETAPRIGVHIRAERLFLKLKGNFVKCLKKLDDTIKIVLKNFKTTPQVRVIHDLGKYGTTGCKDNYCTKTYKLKFLSELKRLNLEAVYYEPDDNPSFPRTSMFAAFVEREYLSTSDVLVTVGFGGFQMILVEQFLHRSIKNKEHLHRICL